MTQNKKPLRTFVLLSAIALPLLSVAHAFAEPPEAEAPAAPAVTPPVLIQAVDPVYPDEERARGATATVLLTLTLDEAGKVTAAVVTESASPAFDAAAVTAAYQLSFQPATSGGNPVPARIPFRFDFALKTEPAAEPPPAPVAPEVAKAPAPAPAPAAAPAPLEELEIEVEGEQAPREPSKRVLSGEEIRKIPGTNGDALRAVQNMPGVARPAGLDGLIIVRGSSPRDSQVMIDGVNAPLAFHFGGLSSVIPSEMLERIDFYPGNFGPEYGRATGGIVDVGVRSPRSDGLHGLLQVDMLDARVMAEGPIGDKTRFMLGGRRSWLDAWLGGMLQKEGIGVTTAPVYYDYQAMLEHDLSDNTTLQLFGYGSDDRLKLLVSSPDAQDPSEGGGLGYSSSFYRVQARLDTRLSSRARWITTLAAGQDHENVMIGSMQADTKTTVVNARSDLRVRLSPAVTAVTGVDAHWAAYDALWRLPPIDIDTGESSGPLFGRPFTELDATGSTMHPAAYAMLELSPVSNLRLLPGVRVDYQSELKTVTVDPRLGVRYDLLPGYPRTTLKGGVGLFHQPPEPYESLEPFGTPSVRSESALHYSLGVEQELARPVEVSVEGFYKDLRDQVVAVPDAEGSQSGFSHQNIGSGRSYGAELLVRYKQDRWFSGWIAYTLSRSERQDGPNQPTYRYQYDQTHILTALGNVDLGRGWETGARFRYVTGSPYTPVDGGVMDYDAGAYAPIDSTSSYSARLPAFHQLDVRVEKTWKFKSWKLSAYLDLENAYNHQNVEGISYNYNYSKTTPSTGLPILPIIGVRGEL